MKTALALSHNFPFSIFIFQFIKNLKQFYTTEQKINQIAMENSVVIVKIVGYVALITSQRKPIIVLRAVINRVVALRNKLCGISATNGERIDRFCNNASRQNYRAVSNDNARHNQHIGEHKTIVADFDRHAFCLKLRGTDIVSERVDFCVMRNCRVRAYFNSAAVIKIAAKIHNRVFSHLEFSNMEKLATTMN